MGQVLSCLFARDEESVEKKSPQEQDRAALHGSYATEVLPGLVGEEILNSIVAVDGGAEFSISAGEEHAVREEGRVAASKCCRYGRSTTRPGRSSESGRHRRER
eukprot:599334-Hanusia_phi.AAC.1